MSHIIVVGGGHAAAQFCASMIDAGQGERVVMVSDEAHVPYQRPPLSKTYLKDAEPTPAWIRADSYYTGKGVALRLSSRAVGIDRQARQLRLEDGSMLPYEKLVLATGTRARTLPGLEGMAANVHTLRTLKDAAGLREQARSAERVLVLGGGFIGLEIAATLTLQGKQVTLLEAGPRLLARSVSPEVSQFLLAHHRSRGVDIRLDAAIERFEGDEQGVTRVWLGGESLPVDLVVVGIGALPNDELAREAGLVCENGIVVDTHMQTSDPHVLAIGDCTAFPSHILGRHVRLESVQNANDQARCAAATILGQAQPYRALPWFWSDQGEVRLQIVGLAQAHHERVLRGALSDGKFSVMYFDGDMLAAVESINMPSDHMAARKLVAAGGPVPRDQAVDVSVPLKSLETQAA